MILFYRVMGCVGSFTRSVEGPAYDENFLSYREPDWFNRREVEAYYAKHGQQKYTHPWRWEEVSTSGGWPSEPELRPLSLRVMAAATVLGQFTQEQLMVERVLDTLPLPKAVIREIEGIGGVHEWLFDPQADVLRIVNEQFVGITPDYVDNYYCTV
jgi:hypothetical protein